MADVKISALTELTSATTEVDVDVLAIVDNSAGATKKISVENVLDPIVITKGSPSVIANLGTVTTADINGGTWQGTIDGAWTAAGVTCANLGTVSAATSITSTAFVGDMTGTASIATTVTVADESSDTTCFPLFATAATGNLPPKSGSNLTFNSSTGLLTSTLLAGALTGNVAGNLTGTVLTAAQTNITTLGTILTFASTGIDDNSTTNAMTIDSTEQTTFTRVGNVNDNKATLKVVPTDVHGMGISVYSNTANESNPLVQIEQGHSGGTMPALRVIQSGTAADTAWLGESGGAVVIGSNTAATVAGATDLTVGNATGAHGITILSNAGLISSIFFNELVGTATGKIEYDNNIQDMFFTAGSARRMTINSTGVGIGIAAPVEKFETNGAIKSTGALNADGTSDISIDHSGGEGRIISHGASGTDAIITFRCGQGASGTGEIMRLKQDGTVGIGGTATSITGDAMLKVRHASNATWLHLDGASGYNSGFKLGHNNAIKWYIYSEPSGAGDLADRIRITDAANDHGMYIKQDYDAWYALSDERMKTSLTPIENAVDKLNTLQAVNFKWKYGSSESKATNRLGLLAQEVYEVFPEVVDSSSDADFKLIDHPSIEGEKQAEGAWALSLESLVPVLVKAVQELSAKVTALENA